ncbi:hypothetical protein SDC9_197415 [bioreactor metagenome]|uniref:Uncharacterized protein n=1 Tax=bioreactor metagenome TaxID=1076179 RepID=A0A645IR97_9ZZZZ
MGHCFCQHSVFFIIGTFCGSGAVCHSELVAVSVIGVRYGFRAYAFFGESSVYIVGIVRYLTLSILLCLHISVRIICVAFYLLINVYVVSFMSCQSAMINLFCNFIGCIVFKGSGIALCILLGQHISV